MHLPWTISIDVREACRPKRDGKGQWTYGFVAELLRRSVPVELWTDTDLPQEWAEKATAHRIDVPGLRWHLRVVSRLRSRADNVLYISPTSYIVPALAGSSVQCVPVVHDLIAFRQEPHNRRATLIERFTLGRATKFAQKILTVSESTREDLLRRYPSLSPAKIVPVFAGPMREKVPLNEPDGRTILCIATLSPRKNQLRLIQAYASLPAELREKHRLVLVGNRGWDDDAVVDAVKKTPGVEWKGYASGDEYERLLHTCTIFALPSLYEGFGMQILDALQRGVPIVTSDRGSLQEVAGNAAMMVDPESVESIAKGLEMLLCDSALRKSLRAQGPIQAAHFSWKRSVELFLEAVR